MRILIINSAYPPIQYGGAEVSVSLLANALVNHGDEVAVISLHQGEDETCGTVDGVRVYRCPIDNFYWPFGLRQKPSVMARLLWHLRELWNSRAAERVGRIMDIEKPDVVHTNNITGFSVSIWREARRRRIRLVHTLRDYGLICLHSGMFRGKSVCKRQCLDCKVYSSIRRLCSQQVDAVVSNSSYVLTAHKKSGFFVNVPSEVIYNIAGTSPKERVEPQDRSDDVLNFGYIGELDERKGVRAILESTRHLKLSNWKLRIAGRGLEQYVAKLKADYPDPRIQWLGFVKATDFYTTVDVVIVSSIWPEPLPRSLIEALALGRSAICARSGGIPEISQLGKLVEMYSPCDYRELAGIMDRAMKDVTRWRSGGFTDPSAADVFTESVARYREVYRGS